MITGHPKPALHSCPGQTNATAQPGGFPHYTRRSGGACQTGALVSLEDIATLTSPVVCTGAMRPWASGPSGLSSTAWPDSMTSCVPVGRAALRTSRSPLCSSARSPANPRPARTGAFDKPPRSAGFPAPPSVHRLFQAFALQPHRSRSFKLSTDPFFIEKVRDIVGLY